MHQKLDGDCKIWKKKKLVISKKNSNMFFGFKIEIMCNMFYGSGFADIQTFNAGHFLSEKINYNWPNSCQYFMKFLFLFSTGFV